MKVKCRSSAAIVGASCDQATLCGQLRRVACLYISRRGESTRCMADRLSPELVGYKVVGCSSADPLHQGGQH